MSTILLAPAVLLLLVTLTSANGPGYTLTRWTVDGGGGTLTSSGYTLSGTTGQPDADVLTGEGYVLSGGFWGGAEAGEYAVYLPLVLRDFQ